MNGRVGGGGTGRQTDRETDRQRQTERETGRERERIMFSVSTNQNLESWRAELQANFLRWTKSSVYGVTLTV